MYFVLFLTPFTPQFHDIQYPVLSHHCYSPTDSEEVKVESHASSETRTRRASWHTARVTRSQQHQYVGGNTVQLATEASVHAPDHHKESLEREGTRTSQPAKLSPNQDDAGPIVSHLMDLPVKAVCDTAQIWSDASSSDQNLRPLHLSGGHFVLILNTFYISQSL
jgi:hypothetical protein